MKKIGLICAVIVASTLISATPSFASNSSSIQSQIFSHINKDAKSDNDLRFKVKAKDKTLTIYSIEGFRTYEYMSSYYIDILRALQKTNLNNYEILTINSEFDKFTFNTSDIKSLPLSDKSIKQLGYKNDDTNDPNYDDFIDEYLKNKAINYQDKTNN